MGPFGNVQGARGRDRLCPLWAYDATADRRMRLWRQSLACPRRQRVTTRR